MNWNLIFFIFIGLVIFNISTEKKQPILKQPIIKKPKRIASDSIKNLEKKKVKFSEPEFTMLNIPQRPQFTKVEDEPQFTIVEEEPQLINNEPQINLDEYIDIPNNSIHLETFAVPNQTVKILKE
jgi:hypothetical protein